MPKVISVIILLALSSVSVNALSAGHKQEVCHKGKEISVAQSAVSAHENHGDTLGDCDEASHQPVTAAVVMMRCEAIVGNGVVVVSASSSFDFNIPVIQIFPPVGDPNCAQALAELLNSDAKFRLRSITSGVANSGEGDDGDLHLYTDYLLIGKVPADS